MLRRHSCVLSKHPARANRAQGATLPQTMPMELIVSRSARANSNTVTDMAHMPPLVFVLPLAQVAFAAAGSISKMVTLTLVRIANSEVSLNGDGPQLESRTAMLGRPRCSSQAAGGLAPPHWMQKLKSAGMPSLQPAHAQSSVPAWLGSPLTASAFHVPFAVPHSGQKAKESPRASPHPPHSSSGGGFGAPAGKPHSTQNLNDSGQNSPHQQLHSSLTSGGGLCLLAVPVNESPQVGQNLKPPGTVQSPSVSSLVLEHVRHVQSAAGGGVGAFFATLDEPTDESAAGPVCGRSYGAAPTSGGSGCGLAATLGGWSDELLCCSCSSSSLRIAAIVSSAEAAAGAFELVAGAAGALVLCPGVPPPQLGPGVPPPQL